MTTKTTRKYIVTIRTLGRGGESRETTMVSPDSETPGELYDRAVKKLYGKRWGFRPDLPGYPNIGQLTTPGTGSEKGCTVLHGRVKIETDYAE
jgi:hypothetical protein